MLGEDPFRKRLTSFSVGLPRTVCLFGNDFIALEMKESLLTFPDDNFCKFHVLYACKGDACALKTRGRFVTERGKKKRKERKPKFKPRPHCLGNNLTATAICQLKQQEIIRKHADKGSGTVVMDKTWSINECNWTH